MGMFFNYDGASHKHSIMAMPIENEKGETVGYRPYVTRNPPKNRSGLVVNMSEKHVALKYRCFSTETLCRDYAIKFFAELEYNPKEHEY